MIHPTKPLIIASFCLLTSFLGAQEDQSFDLQADSYAEAETQASFIRFEMDHSKFGMSPSPFLSYVTQAHISWKNNGDRYQDVHVEIPAESIDTGSRGRNGKMLEKCLSADVYPSIHIHIREAMRSDQPATYPATIEVRGKTFPISIDISSCDESQIKGSSTLNFKNLEIPDPSILIAKLHEDIRVEFSIDTRRN